MSCKKLTGRVPGLFTGLVETWKDVQDYEGSYQISSFGRVKSLARMRLSSRGSYAKLPERIMALKTDKHGYKIIGFHSNGKKFFSVHRLVASAFIPNINNKNTVNHIDCDKSNNNVCNLEWSSHSEQMQHAVANNLLEVRGSPKYSKEYKQEIFDYYQKFKPSLLKLAETFNVSERTAGRIANQGVKPRSTTRILKTGEVIIEDILSKDEVSQIKELRESGWTLKDIGNKFNRGTSQIHRITRNESRVTEIE